MFKLFQPKPKGFLGLDIRPSSIKLVALGYQEACLQLESYQEAKLPAHAFDAMHIKDVSAVSTCIKNLCNDLPCASMQVAIAVPDATVLFKTICAHQSLNDKELEQLVHFEVGNFIPSALDEIYLDFCVQGPNVINPQMNDVLIAACKAEVVLPRLAAVRAAGLEVTVVDVTSLAMTRALEVCDEGLIALLEMGSQVSQLLLIKNKQVLFCHELPIGAFELADIQQQQVLLQIQRSLQLYYSGSQYEPIKQLLLAGQQRTIQSMAAWLETQLGVSARLVNPFAHLSVDTHDATGFLLASGLAQRLAHSC